MVPMIKASIWNINIKPYYILSISVRVIPIKMPTVKMKLKNDKRLVNLNLVVSSNLALKHLKPNNLQNTMFLNLWVNRKQIIVTAIFQRNIEPFYPLHSLYFLSDSNCLQYIINAMIFNKYESPNEAAKIDCPKSSTA